MLGKIALEEHVSTPENNAAWDSRGETSRNGEAYMNDVEERLLDVDTRISDMDRHGIERAILSLTSPGIQSITDVSAARAAARNANDYLHDVYVAAHPSRLGFFAAVALQDPVTAADELERAVKDLGAHGALINGYTNTGTGDEVSYLDDPANTPFWQRVSDLAVPVYLHPREPVASQRLIYQGYGSLLGSAWGFGHETGTHAVRLMLSGLFDVFPDIQIILGHLGEGLPFLLPRLSHRLGKQREGAGLGAAKRPVEEYFHQNFYLTTSGHFHTKALLDAISEIGSDRLLFAVDYPYESMAEACDWFDDALLPENDRVKIGSRNAKALLDLR
ncbi:TIM-barrel fold metal-dependent hydrolase [Mycobacteroides abscessus]|nr:TIM-barrel fold metal-dependent hydrolase [Mycobacteroides abscessus]